MADSSGDRSSIARSIGRRAYARRWEFRQTRALVSRASRTGPVRPTCGGPVHPTGTSPVRPTGTAAVHPTGTSPARPTGTGAVRLTGAAAGALALALFSPLLTAAAAAVASPAVSTGGATAVSFGSAMLGGTVDPRGRDTSYYFQYGATKAYGLQTGILDAGSGSRGVRVAIAIGGLQPLTQYHYRLVAVNSGGFGYGGDRAFHTTKVPLSLAILASPNPVLYEGAFTVQGTLSGTDNANRTVVLQANPFPYTAGFANYGNPELTNGLGSFSFPLIGAIQGTQYRVVTTTNPPVASPVVLESVDLRVSAAAGHVGPRGKALFHGTVSPAMEHAEIAVMRQVHGRQVFVAGTRLRHRTTRSSRFSLLAKARRGNIYRILVHIPGGPLSSTYSAPILVR